VLVIERWIWFSAEFIILFSLFLLRIRKITFVAVLRCLWFRD